MQKGNGRLVGLQLSDTAWAAGQVTFEISMHAGRQMMLDEIREKSDEIVAAAFH